MPISIKNLAEELSPEKTVIILGAGASIPSNAPTVFDLIKCIADEFNIPSEGLQLSEISSLAESKRNRRDLITCIRAKFSQLKPKGAILNFPLYQWKSIFSTNYDELIEDAYEREQKLLKSYSSNFDFDADVLPNATKLFKFHGTINKDISDGHRSRVILTSLDYDDTEDYREALYDRLRSDISPGTTVLIIGQSLADPDLKDIIQRAISINQKSSQGGKIALLLYQHDENRAKLFEMRGLRVAFGGLDELMRELSKKLSDHTINRKNTHNPLDQVAELRPITHEIQDEVDIRLSNPSGIFNGWPANYADIVAGLTFDRDIALQIVNFLNVDDKISAVLLGASGVGKTTAARQALLKLKNSAYIAWEHKSDHPFVSKYWTKVAKRLEETHQKGVLFIDDAHAHLYEINDLIDLLSSTPLRPLKVILVSTKNHWSPRIKTPNLFNHGKDFYLSQLNTQEIDRLLSLVETAPALKKLVESGFSGFSRNERKRRLMVRCEADMFVCMKNIFASEKFDDIILREYGTLSQDNQDVYRSVAAMEHAGIHVHRQLVMRILGIPANTIAATLVSLTDIVNEYDVNEREGVYGWRIRHIVIAGIIAKYKFHDTEKLISLFHKVIDNISPTFDIEIRTIRELCNIESGLSVIPSKNEQNVLLRKMMSVAPGERVPRHRLIRNLIDLGEFEKADSEIRIFENDFGREAPVARYGIMLMIARSANAPGLMYEDRKVILDQARELASSAISKYSDHKYVLSVYCELGIEYFKLTGSHEVFDDAIQTLKRAESRLGDPEITKMIAKFQRRISGQQEFTDSTEVLI